MHSPYTTGFGNLIKIGNLALALTFVQSLSGKKSE